MARATRIMRLMLTAATIAVCLLLCWQAIDIYLTGTGPDALGTPVYSRQIVEDRLAAISPALLAYLALAAAGLIFQAASGGGTERPSPFLAEERLRSLRRRVAQTPPEAQAEQRRRRIVQLAAGAVVLLCAVLAGTYLLDAGNFTSLDLEPVVGSMMLHVSPWAALALASAAAAAVFSGKSVLREAEILRSAPQQEPPPAEPAARGRALPALRAALYAAAVLLIVLGVMNGGLWDVLVKAVNICTECIGLG